MIPHMWFGVPEELLAPEPALPVQVQHVWHHTRAISSERRLILAMIWQAILDLRKYRFAKRMRDQRLYMEAYEWVESDDRTWPYSFANLCELLNLHVESARAQVLDLSQTEPRKIAGDMLDEAA